MDGHGHTFCELTARFRFAKSDCGSTVPKKMDLNWFMPAFVKSRVGSDRGTTGAEATVHRSVCGSEAETGSEASKWVACVP